VVQHHPDVALADHEVLRADQRDDARLRDEGEPLGGLLGRR
jgi:hypothetical protein